MSRRRKREQLTKQIQEEQAQAQFDEFWDVVYGLPRWDRPRKWVESRVVKELPHEQGEAGKADVTRRSCEDAS